MRDINNYEQEYTSVGFEQKYQVVYRRRKVLEVLRKYCPAHILEVGCGLDSIGKYIDDYQEFTVVEPGKSFLEQAREDLQNRQNVFLVEGFLEEKLTELKMRHYDIIIISSLLHEIEEPHDFLKKVKEVCSTNTMVHINVPNAYSLHRILAYEGGLITDVYESSDRNVMLQQNTVFSLETLKDLVRQAGGAIIEEGSYFVKPFTHQQMDKCLAQGIFDERVLEGLYNLDKHLPEYGSEIYVNFRFENA